MKHGSTSRTQSHSTIQAWVNCVAASFIFSSSPPSLCVLPMEWWKVNSEMMDNRPTEHRWGDRCSARAKPGWAQSLLVMEGKKNPTVKIFPFLYQSCSAVAMSESGAVVPQAGTRAASRVTVKNRPTCTKSILSNLPTSVRLSFPRSSFFSSLFSVYLSSFGDWAGLN